MYLTGARIECTLVRCGVNTSEGPFGELIDIVPGIPSFNKRTYIDVRPKWL